MLSNYIEQNLYHMLVLMIEFYAHRAQSALFKQHVGRTSR